MKKHYISIIVIITLLIVFVGQVYADQVSVNIVYPIAGASYPKMDRGLENVRSAYFTASFSVTCVGGHKVEWGFDDAIEGKASFLDQISVQFVHKLGKGDHLFKVRSDCGENAVKFKIGQ